MCCEQGSEAVLGYYTLSWLSIALSGLPEDKARRLPRHPVPAALIGRLAVSEGVQGQGIGRLLLADAVKRSLAVSEEIAIDALVVDARDERASRFYQSFGFKNWWDSEADSSSLLDRSSSGWTEAPERPPASARPEQDPPRPLGGESAVAQGRPAVDQDVAHACGSGRG